MRLEVLAVGRLKAGPEKELYTRYCDRIARSGKSLHLTGPHLFEINESRAGDTLSRKKDEAHQLLAKTNASTRIMVLDEHGKDVSSQQFAELIRSEQAEGTSAIAFALGGPDGHGEEIKLRSTRTLRFGSMTWPHQLARVMLVEQLYRAITIMSGHPYHRE
ncbi:MAG: 23S rRNA (pseudouridine(1915)-N(3))-methyltransferase RlmH [Pseudomonadota bacterium]